MNDWHKLARKKFPYGQITGDGRWACVRRCHQRLGRRWKISLHETQERAERAAARECSVGCAGVYDHFVTTVTPPETTTPAPVVKPTVKAPPLIEAMRS